MNPHNELKHQKFEGPEKKIEIILTHPVKNLRNNSDQKWESVVAASGSGIISAISSSELDAYLLSESSLFVWDDRILMITCGKTTLTHILPELFKFIDKSLIKLLFYERKNFIYPSEQPSNFKDEVAYIENFFPGKNYRLGPANHDHVHLFYYAPIEEPDPILFSCQELITENIDTKLQILMHDLDPEVIKSCYKNNHNENIFSSISTIYEKMTTDSHFFTPYGFSLNGIMEKQYYTVHISPQRESSYASFETNVPEANYFKTINKILTIFKPGKFTLVFTTLMDKKSLAAHESITVNMPEYRLTEKSLYEFDCHYCMTFFNQKRIKEH